MTTPRLAGHTILLTGASGGIGAAIARRLARHGARLVLVARSAAGLDGVRAALPAAGAPHLCVAADVTAPSGRDAIRAALAPLGVLHALINNAGISRFALLSDATPEQVEAQLATNVAAPILLAQLVLPLLERAGGRIVNVGSSFGGIGYPGYSTYCASKFALRGFTEALRRELGDSTVQVAYLAPRATRTALNGAAVDALNAALGNATDPPQRVAACVERMLLAPVMRDAAIGWPERVVLRVNALFPALVDGVLRRQLATIKRYAAPVSTHRS